MEYIFGLLFVLEFGLIYSQYVAMGSASTLPTTAYDGTWTRSLTSSYFTGLYAVHNNHHEDRIFTWRYRRPLNGDNPQGTGTIALATTSYDATFERSCSLYNSGNAAIQSIYSVHEYVSKLFFHA